MKKVNGYAALVLVILLLFTILAIGLSASYAAVSKLTITQSSMQNLQNKANLESCAEESLLRINEDNVLPNPIEISILGEDVSCSTELEDYTLNQYTYIITLGDDRLRIIAQRSDKVYIMKWEIL